MGVKVLQIPQKDADGERWASVSFLYALDDVESLTGTPEATEVGTTDLTIANVANSTSSMEINGETVAAGKAVRFTISGGTAGTVYDLQVIGYSNSSPNQKIVADLKLEVT